MELGTLSLAAPNTNLVAKQNKNYLFDQAFVYELEEKVVNLIHKCPYNPRKTHTFCVFCEIDDS